MSGNTELLRRMRKASKAVYLACKEPVADDLSLLLSMGADRIAELQCRLTQSEQDAERTLKQICKTCDKSSSCSVASISAVCTGWIGKVPTSDSA